MIVVVDTNTLINGLITPGSNGDRILQAIVQRRLQFAITPHLRSELERALGYRHLQRLLERVWNEHQLSAAVLNLLSLAIPVPDLEPTHHWVEADPDDDWVIQCAISAGADRIVTGDRAVLALKAIGSIEIVTPAVFVQELHQ